MNNSLLIFSSLFTAAPGIILFLFGQSGFLQAVGVAIIILGALAGLVSLGSSRTSIFSWIALIFSLSILVLGNGYSPSLTGISFGFTLPLAELFALSIMLIEASIAISAVFGTYRKYSIELKKTGYEKAEFENELGAFGRFIFLVVLGTAALSIFIFFGLSIIPQIPIDSLSGLVIAIIIYFVVARYILRRPPSKRQV
jgi:hypothetical protein